MKPRIKSWRTTTILSLMALVVIVSISQQPALAAGPWYVAPSGSDGNSCLSPGAPCASINGAIGKASSGDMIRVTTGTYTGDTGNEVVLLSKSITISGGWNSSFTTQGGVSAINAQGFQWGITVNNSIIADIDRFVVQNGSAGGIINEGNLTVNNSIISANMGFGGILNNATLILNNSTISNNSWHGIYNNSLGQLTLSSSTVANNIDLVGGSSIGGGGIANAGGTVIINNSAITKNTAYRGAGIYNSWGTLTINNSTISSNASLDRGGGIANDTGGTVILNNSTISDNNGGIFGGGINNFGTLILNSTTVSANYAYQYGSGIYNGNTTTLQNSALAGNASAQLGSDCAGTLSSLGYNLIGSTANCSFVNTTGDLVNVNAKLWTTLIGSLGVHPLVPGSPAIDAGNPSGCKNDLGNLLTTDQRGVARVGRCDIGAYEFDPGNNPIRQVFLPLVRTTCKPGVCGRVTLIGTPVASISLELRFFNGTSWYTLATTNTDADGYYSFASVPSLTPGQRYYVRYRNYAGTPGRLWVWGTRELTSYSANSNFEIGNFDIADIPLIAPANDATVALPYAFQWTRRTATPSDAYELDLYDPTDGNPYFFTAPPLGYVGTYMLNGLPPGFSPGAQYVWEIWVYSPDGGFGISYETRTIKFSNTGMSVTTTIQLTQPETKLDLEDRRKK